MEIIETAGEGKRYLCECMQVKTSSIQEMISQGTIAIEEIIKKTGAGTVCGVCRPWIHTLLGGEGWTDVTITAIKEHNSLIRSFQLTPVNQGVLPSIPGQHIVVEANIDGLWVARPYTLTSIAKNDYYEITVKHEEKGIFSPWLFNHAKVRTCLRTSAPQRETAMSLSVTTPILFLVGGIGITPAVAFARYLISNHQNRPLHIDYSVSSSDFISFGDELANWPKDYPFITVHIRLTRRDGYLKQSNLQRYMTSFPDADIFICGPDTFKEQIITMLKAVGIPSEKIFMENFVPAGKK